MQTILSSSNTKAEEQAYGYIVSTRNWRNYYNIMYIIMSKAENMHTDVNIFWPRLIHNYSFFMSLCDPVWSVLTSVMLNLPQSLEFL